MRVLLYASRYNWLSDIMQFASVLSHLDLFSFCVEVLKLFVLIMYGRSTIVQVFSES